MAAASAFLDDDDKKLLLVVINPASGSKKAVSFWTDIVRPALDQKRIPYSVHFSELETFKRNRDVCSPSFVQRKLEVERAKLSLWERARSSCGAPRKSSSKGSSSALETGTSPDAFTKDDSPNAFTKDTKVFLKFIFVHTIYTGLRFKSPPLRMIPWRLGLTPDHDSSLLKM